MFPSWFSVFIVLSITVDSIEGAFDWLLKPQISFAIHLLATRVGFAPENNKIIAEMSELESSFCALTSRCFRVY